MTTASAALLAMFFAAAPATAPQNRSAPARTKGEGMDVQAKARFEELWRGAIRTATAPEEWKRHDALVRRGPTSVREIECRELHRQIVDTHGAQNRPTSFHGVLKALERDGRCWEVAYDGLLTSGLAAAVAPDGEVLFVWVMPEG